MMKELEKILEKNRIQFAITLLIFCWFIYIYWYIFDQNTYAPILWWWMIAFLYQQRRKQQQEKRLKESEDIKNQIILFEQLWKFIHLLNNSSTDNNTWLLEQISICRSLAELWIKHEILYKICLENLSQVENLFGLIENKENSKILSEAWKSAKEYLLKKSPYK